MAADGEPMGTVGERLGLEREDVVLRKIQDPKLPSEEEEEVERHILCGHIPYRSWCGICVKAMGKEDDHRADKGKERRLPEYSFDYCFPGDELGFKWTVLVGKERMSGSRMATTVPMKGGTGKFAIDKVLDFIEENGDREGDILIKSDQDPSIEYVIKDVVAERADGEDSSVGVTCQK